MTGRGGCGSIVLLHNAGEHTPEALPEILQCLKQREYEIVPVLQLLLTGDHILDYEGGSTQRSRAEMGRDLIHSAADNREAAGTIKIILFSNIGSGGKNNE